MRARESTQGRPLRFLITIDTEGDNLWSRPVNPSTRNAAHLQRFQDLCERYGFRPTYVVNYEMACDRTFVGFGKRILDAGTGEIGMHLHAWNSPPLEGLTSDDLCDQPYLVEYSLPVMRRKITYLTNLLQDTFGTRMVSHRAGRWVVDQRYATLLQEAGYKVDCSVTPHVCWPARRTAPAGSLGADYRDCPPSYHWLVKPTDGYVAESGVLEVPMTVVNRRPKILASFAKQGVAQDAFLNRAFDKLWPNAWLRPNGLNLKSMLRIVDEAVARSAAYVEFMLHSSELMPGGSPSFPTEESIESLYKQMESLFRRAAVCCCGRTLKEFHSDVIDGLLSPPRPYERLGHP